MSQEKPLRPLSEHAIGVLRSLAKDSRAQHLVNPGVRQRLFKEGLAATYNGHAYTMLCITAAGREALAKIDGKG